MPTQRTIWGNLFNLLALLALLAPSKSFSAQITWLGNNSTDIRDAANWVGDVAPAPNTDSALFGVAGTFGVNIVNPLSGANQQYAGNFILGEGGLQFSSAAPSYTFSGSSIRLGNGGVWNASSGTTQTFNNDFSLNTTNSFTFDANNAQTVVNGDIDLLQGVGTRTISVAFRNTVGSVLTLNGDLVNSNATPGTGSLTTTTTSSALATQAGYVVLRGNNSSLNGTITVAGGTTVRTESANGLGTAAISLTTAAQVGTLEIGLDTGTTFSNAISGATSTGGTMRLVSDRATAGAGVTHGISFASNTMTSSGGIAIFQAGQNVTSGSAGFNVGALTLGAASNTGLLSVGANVTIASLAPVNTAGSTNNFQLGTYNTGLAGSNDGRFTITGALANGSGGRNATLTTFGTGIVTLQGTNTYTGTTTLNGGRLVLDYGTNNTSKLADGFALNLNSGILDLAGGSHTEVVASTTISTAGSQIIRSSGTSVINLGAITQSSGGLNIAEDNIAQTTTTNVNGRLAGFSRITVGTGSTASFAKNSGGNIVGMEAADYTTLTNTSSTNGSTVYNLNGNLTYNVAPSGTGLGSLRIQGGSSLVFTGITNAPTLGNSTTGSGSAGLLFGGSSDFTISSNVTSNPIRSVSGNLLIHHWGTGNLTLGGTGGTASGVTNAVVGSGIEKYGTGRLIISGNNTNTSTAPLAVYGGTVQIDRNGAIGNVTTGGSVTLNGGGRLLVDTTNGSVALNNAGANHRNIVIGTGGGTLDVIGGNTVTVSGVISNSLAGNNGAPVTFGSSESNGTIVLSGSGTSSNFNTFLGGVILAGGTVRVEKGEAQTPFSGAGSVTSGSATVTGLSSTAGLVVGQAVSFTGATLPAGTVIQSIDSATQITLTQAATSTNATANVAIAAGGALGRGATNNPGNHNYITFAGGTLQYSATNTTDYSGRFARVANQSFRIDTNGQNVGFAYGLVGADSTLTKLGSGTLTLNGTNTYTGTTTVTAGTLAFGENNRLLSTGAVSVNGGDLAVGTTTQTVGTVTLSSGNITGSTGRLVGSAYNVHSGNISATLAGSGSLTKSTGGTVVLSGNNTFTGATLVSGGTLQAAAAGALGSTSNLTVNTGGTLWLTANNTVNDAADVTLGGGTILKGPGAVSETFGALELTADSSLSFGTAIGTLNFGTYNGGAFKLNVSNFQEGNILTFRTDLSSSIEDTALFGFDNAFSYAWDSSSTTFTITAIPEPSAVAAAIAFLGLAALRGIRRRRTQNSQTEI